MSITVGLFSVPDNTIGKIVVSGDIDKENGPPNGLYVITFYVTAYDSAGHNDTVSHISFIILMSIIPLLLCIVLYWEDKINNVYFCVAFIVRSQSQLRLLMLMTTVPYSILPSIK